MPVFRLEMVPSFHHTNIVSPKMLTSFVMNKIFFFFFLKEVVSSSLWTPNSPFMNLVFIFYSALRYESKIHFTF